LLKDELPNEVIEDLNREEHLNIRQGVSIMNSLKAILKDNKYFHLSKYKGDGFYKTYSKLVKLLRYKLAEACTTLMDADLFILDEFQRFNQLLEYNENSEAENDGLAFGQKTLRNNKNKVLMLSATPFKPFSTDYDETNGEHHNIEFDKVISFL